MGRNNSSELRVRPLGEYLLKNKADVDKLLHLVGCSRVCFGMFDDGKVFFSAKDQDGHSRSELGLEPSAEHLKGIINFFEKKADENDREYARKYVGKSKDSHTKAEREKWFENCRSEDAFNALDRGETWPVFEGKTRPDLIIEGERYVIIIEGKLTEKEATKKTVYLRSRDQMVRHIQGALNHFKGKKIIAFYIVPEGFKELGLLKERTCINEVLEVEADKYGISLESCEKIRKSYYGCTTWEKVEKTLKISFPEVIK